MFTTPVREAMTSPVISCPPELSVRAAHERLAKHRISSLAVVSGERLVGVVSRADLLEMSAAAGGAEVLPERPVSSCMTAPAVTVGVDTPMREAAATMLARKIHRVYVADDERPIGVVSTRDTMDAIAGSEVDAPISELASVPVHTIDVEAQLSDAIARLDALGVSALIVCEHEQPIGVLTQRGALAALGLDARTPVEEAMDAAVICLHNTAGVVRAARLARRMGVRRIVTTRHRKLHGVISGMDFARFVATA